MQIISLNNLTANIFWFLTPCPGQEQAVFPADSLASFGALGLGYFDFKEAREACETGRVAGEKKNQKNKQNNKTHTTRGEKKAANRQRSCSAQLCQYRRCKMPRAPISPPPLSRGRRNKPPRGEMRHPPFPLLRLSPGSAALPVCQRQRGKGEGASSLTGRACLGVRLCLLLWLLFLPPKRN